MLQLLAFGCRGGASNNNRIRLRLTSAERSAFGWPANESLFERRIQLGAVVISRPDSRPAQTCGPTRASLPLSWLASARP